MSIIFIVLPLALVIVLAGMVAFVWAARRGQYDDLETPALRVLHDDITGGGTGSAGGRPRSAGGASQSDR